MTNRKWEGGKEWNQDEGYPFGDEFRYLGSSVVKMGAKRRRGIAPRQGGRSDKK